MKIPPSTNPTTSSLIYNPGSARKAWKLSLLTAFLICTLSVQGAIITGLDVQYVTNDTTYDLDANIPAGHTLLDWKTWNGTGGGPEMLGGSGQIDRALTDSGQNFSSGNLGLTVTWTGGTVSGPSDGTVYMATSWVENIALLQITGLQPGLTYEAQFVSTPYFVNPTVTLQSGGTDTFETDGVYLDTVWQTHSAIATVQFNTETGGDVLTLSGSLADWSGAIMAVRLTAVPEPSTYALFVGVFGIGFAIWRRSRRAV